MLLEWKYFCAKQQPRMHHMIREHIAPMIVLHVRKQTDGLEGDETEVRKVNVPAEEEVGKEEEAEQDAKKKDAIDDTYSSSDSIPQSTSSNKFNQWRGVFRSAI